MEYKSVLCKAPLILEYKYALFTAVFSLEYSAVLISEYIYVPMLHAGVWSTKSNEVYCVLNMWV
jgi:hypothetical protein